MDLTLDQDIMPRDWSEENSIIKVIGVGGGGCNAVNYMYKQKIKGCNFIVCNTDSQALFKSEVPTKIQMGAKGLGAGTDPVEGRNAALESQDEIAAKVLDNGTEMLFITAGMGGGTGTGASPVIAKMAKDRGILTVAVVTIPFKNEGNESQSKTASSSSTMRNCTSSSATPSPTRPSRWPTRSSRPPSGASSRSSPSPATSTWTSRMCPR